MNGGEIKNNSTSYGGGVYINSGTFTMTGGTTSGNSTTQYGGVFAGQNSSVTLGGTAYVRGNTAGSLSESNIHLQNSAKTIVKASTVTPLTTGADIGMTNTTSAF